MEELVLPCQVRDTDKVHISYDGISVCIRISGEGIKRSDVICLDHERVEELTAWLIGYFDNKGE